MQPVCQFGPKLPQVLPMARNILRTFSACASALLWDFAVNLVSLSNASPTSSATSSLNCLASSFLLDGGISQ